MALFLALFSLFVLISAIIILHVISKYYSQKDRLQLWYRNEDGKIRWRIIITVAWLFFAAVFFLIYSYFVLGGNLLTKKNGTWSLNDFGVIGDFVGGFIGSFFNITGVFLLYETLSLQRKEMAESRMYFERQRFEDTFFSMINVYQQIVSEMQIFNGREVYRGKDFFKMLNDITTKSYAPVYNIFQANKTATSLYEQVYILYKENLAHYYRTLYRIFKFIDTSNFENSSKVDYAKTIRALLSEQELFFLYYNAHTNYGTNFKKLINDYHLLKHFPILEKLEFLWLKKKLSQEMVMAIDQVLYELQQNFISVFKGNQRKISQSFFGSEIRIVVHKTKDEIVTSVIIHSRPAAKIFQKGYGLHILSNEDLREMLFSCLHDIIEFQNFRMINKPHEYKKGIEIGSSLTKIYAKVKITATTMIKED